MRLLARLAVLSCAAVVAACGGGSSSGKGADPATFMPAGATVYLEAVVRPEGDQRERMEALAGRLLRTGDPGAKLKAWFDEAIGTEQPGTTYDENVAPWLGERAGMALSDFRGDEPSFVVAIGARDSDAAAEELARTAKKDGDRQASYKDVDYWVDKDGMAAGVVRGAVLLGSDEAQFKRAVDTEEDASLAKAQRYGEAIDGLPDDRVGTFFFDVPSLMDLALKDVPESERAMVKPLFENLSAIAGAVLAEEDQAAIEALMRAPKEGSGGLGALGLGLGSTDLVADAPAGTWAAFGIPKLGQTARETMKLFAGALGGAVVTAQIEKELGINLDRDVFDWIGDVAFFVRGDAVASLEGGAIIQVTDMAKARDAIPKLIGLARQQGGVEFTPARIDGASLAAKAQLPGAPGPLVVALGDGRAAITLGEAAASEALNPKETISDDGVMDRARKATDGMDPSLIVDGPGLMKIVTEAAGSDPDFAKAKPYLDMIDVVAAGSEKDGDRIRSRLGVTLR